MRNVFAHLVALLAFCVAGGGYAQTLPTGAHVPGLNQPMPNYFSGTNCRASGTVYKPADAFIWYAELTINGDVVDSYSYLPQEPVPMSITLNVMWDSTHFVPGTDVEIEISALMGNGAIISDTDDAVVRNDSIAYGRYDLTIDGLVWDDDNAEWDAFLAVDLPGLASDYLYGVNYNIQAIVTDQGWERNQFLSHFQLATAAMVYTHSTPSLAWSDKLDNHDYFPDPFEGFGDDVFTGITGNYSLLNRRVVGNGNGLPPFNSGTPPLNFFFMASCATGASDDWELGALYPYGNEYAGYNLTSPENQALCAYEGAAYIKYHPDAADLLYSSLTSGRTVFLAVDDVNDHLDDEKAPPEMVLSFRGDGATKLHGVYDGFINSTNTGWYL